QSRWPARRAPAPPSACACRPSNCRLTRVYTPALCSSGKPSLQKGACPMSDNPTPSILVEQNIMVPMRDGVRLATDVYRPAAAGRWPVLLTRVPYDKDLRDPRAPDKRVFLELNLDVARAVAAGYVVVAQDTRGRFASEGVFTPVA